MRPVILARQARKTEAVANYAPEPVYDDAIEWCQQEYTSDCDSVNGQISLAMVAIHPTTDQLTETMDLLEIPKSQKRGLSYQNWYERLYILD